MSDTALNYQQLLTETLQSQMVILGPAITLAKAKNVPGLHVNNDGRVTEIDGNPQEVSIKLLEQFRELSPLMVKKTMRPLLNAILTAYPTMDTNQTPATTEQAKTAEDQNDQKENDDHPQEMKHEESKSIEEHRTQEADQKHEDAQEHHEENHEAPQQAAAN